MAGGKYVGGSHLHGFVADERNGVWGMAAEVPGLAALDGGGDATVFSVSCASAGNCAAGGSYHIDHHHQGFVADERNGVWGKAIAVPGLAALNAGGQAIVNTVSCAKAGNCAAGGAYRDRHFHSRAFVAVEQNGVWRRAIGVPRLGTLNKGGNAQVTSVSCASAGNCAGGGDYNRRGLQGFVAVERNGRWGTAVEVPGLSPDGKVLYACSRHAATAAGYHYSAVLAAYHAASGRTIRVLGTWNSDQSPCLLAMAPSGDYALVTGLFSAPGPYAYRVNLSTGKATPVGRAFTPGRPVGDTDPYTIAW